MRTRFYFRALLLICALAQTFAAPTRAQTSNAQSANALTQALRLKRARRFDLAAQLLQREIARRPQNARARYVLGWVEVSRGRRALAVQQLQAALRAGLPTRDAQEARAALSRLQPQLARKSSPAQQAATPSLSPAAGKANAPKMAANAKIANAKIANANANAKALKTKIARAKRPEVLTGSAKRRGSTVASGRRDRRAAVSDEDDDEAFDEAHWEATMRSMTPPFARIAQRALLPMLKAFGLWLAVAALFCFASNSKPGRTDFFMICVALSLPIVERGARYWDYWGFHGTWPYTRLLNLAFVVATGVFLALGGYYAVLRLTKKHQLDKGGLIAWGLFWTNVALVLMFANKTYRGWIYYLIAALFVGLWVWRNPWYFVAQKAGKLRKQNRVRDAIALLETALQKPRLSAKTRFVLHNDVSSYYATLGDHQACMTHAQTAVSYGSAFRSALVLARANIANALVSLERYEEAVDEVARMWHLTETASCFGGNEKWKAAAHLLLARMALSRDWDDEAAVQAQKCLDASPRETRSQPDVRNRVAGARAVQASVRLRAGDLDAALSYANSALKIAESQLLKVSAQTVLAQIESARGNFQSAEALCREALNGEVNGAPVLLTLGQVLRAQHRESEARQAWQTCIELAPHGKDASKARALLAPPTLAELPAPQLMPESWQAHAPITPFAAPEPAAS